jgi:hypothetical protein
MSKEALYTNPLFAAKHKHLRELKDYRRLVFMIIIGSVVVLWIIEQLEPTTRTYRTGNEILGAILFLQVKVAMEPESRGSEELAKTSGGTATELVGSHSGYGSQTDLRFESNRLCSSLLVRIRGIQ